MRVDSRGGMADKCGSGQQGGRVGPALPQGPLIKPDVRISRIRLSVSGAPSQGAPGSDPDARREADDPKGTASKPA